MFVSFKFHNCKGVGLKIYVKNENNVLFKPFFFFDFVPL